MRKVLRLTFVVHVIALLAGFHAAAQAKFTTVTGSKDIGRNEYLRVNFIVENAANIDRLTPPSFPGFRIISGPNQASGMTVVNGSVSQYEGMSFVLQPVKTGKFTIQGATASVDGRLMRSKPVTITVNARGSGAAGNNPNFGPNPLFQQMPDPMSLMPREPDKEYVLKPGENVGDKIRRNLFVKVEVDKPTCYVGEPVVATYKLYSHLRSESRVTKRPSLNGFSVYDMVDPNSEASSVEKINGKPFTVHIIRKTQLIPLQAGTVDLDPMEVENTIHFLKKSAKSAKNGNGPRDLFGLPEDDDAVTNWVDENVTLDTKPLSITVKPLPETARPADYSGAVGQFTIQAGLENRNIAARDGATLQVTIRGAGNLPVINAPKVKWPAGLDPFDPVAKEEVDHTVVPMSGSKSFKYVFSPGAPGVYKIPAIDFSYFDPAGHVYRTIHTDSLICKVAPAAKRSPSSLSTGGTNAAGGTTGGLVGDFIHLHLEWVFAILIFSALAIYLWRQSLRIKKEDESVSGRPSDKPGSDKQTDAHGTEKAGKHGQLGAGDIVSAANSVTPPAPVIVADPLAHARILFAEVNYKGFYKEVNRALWKAIADTVDLSASEMNKSNMIKKLEAKGWDRESVLMLENIFSECEINIYTPVFDTYNMQQVLGQAELLINRV